MNGVVVSFGLLAVVACYRPNTAADACNLTCTSSTTCPNDLTCNAQNRCSVGGALCEAGVGPGDAIPIDPDATSPCAGSNGLLGEICFDTVPAPTPLVPGDPFDTDNDPRCATTIDNEPSICVLVVDEVTRLRATGMRPLVLWSSNTLAISGDIDVASHVGEATPGAGARSCVTEMGVDGQTGAGLAAGGAGGSFGTNGGRGGAGGLANGGAAGGLDQPGNLRGGCPGGSGGGTIKTGRAHAGGAVYLMAAARIIVAGTINASGAGGAGPNQNSGGGGGGSGGMIGFDAPTIQLNSGAVIIALGGGGSSGGFNNTAAGLPGNEPSTAPPFFADLVSGPVNPCTNNRGGQGATGAAGEDGMQGGNGSTTLSCNGGGGGGGSGFVVTSGQVIDDVGVTVLPALPN